MCADQASKFFHENYPKPRHTEYTSHYDVGANVCYILVHQYDINNNGVPSFFDTVYDAFEGRGYATYSWVNAEKKKYSEVEPLECSVKPRGQEEIPCKSGTEFQYLIDKHFGISR